MPNNFAALRLIAASLVVFGHAYAMTGSVAPRWFGIEVHVFAVRIFFTISGYLICESWNRDPNLWRYLWRRALRIMPALLMTVMLTVFVLGPLVTTLPLDVYARAVETRLYLWNAALAPYFVLPGVFADGRPFTAVNGALWSLPVEVVMYLLLPIYGAAQVPAVRWLVLPITVTVALAGGFWFTSVRPDAVQPVVYWTSLPFIARYSSDFVLGAAVRSWRLERWLNMQVAMVLMALVPLLDNAWMVAGIGLLAVPYIVLAFGLATAPLFGGVGRRSDISYGVYLWGGPVQQLWVSALGATVHPLVLATVSLPAAWGCGWVSWHVLERHAMRLKPRVRAAGFAILATPVMSAAQTPATSSSETR